MPECISILLSLICLMVANILIGKKIADFKKEYDKSKLLNGISKAIFFLIGLLLAYASTAIYAMPVIEINGEMVTTLTAATLLIKAANLLYAGKVLVKIKTLLSVDTPVNTENKKEK